MWASYSNNPYHNFRHAVDVLQATFHFLTCIGIIPPLQPSISSPSPKPEIHPIASLLRPIDAFTLCIVALGHDVGHPGVNNQFLVDQRTPLAQIYNDRSILENFHSAALAQLLLNYWPSTQAPEMRKLIFECILATDMAVHFDYLRKFEDISSQSDEGKRNQLCGMLIKCADISNVVCGFPKII